MTGLAHTEPTAITVFSIEVVSWRTKPVCFVNLDGKLVDLIAQQKHLMPMALARRVWTLYKARGCDVPRHGPGRKAGREANGAVQSSRTRPLSLGESTEGIVPQGEGHTGLLSFVAWVRAVIYSSLKTSLLTALCK